MTMSDLGLGNVVIILPAIESGVCCLADSRRMKAPPADRPRPRNAATRKGAASRFAVSRRTRAALALNREVSLGSWAVCETVPPVRTPRALWTVLCRRRWLPSAAFTPPLSGALPRAATPHRRAYHEPFAQV